MDTLSLHAPKGKPHYVYTLAYPNDYSNPLKAGTVFYVGKGQGNRIDMHELEVRANRTAHNPHKANIIRKIWREGKEIKKEKLAYFATHEEASLYEIALIFFIDGLTNRTRGGDGIVGLERSEEHRRKLGQKTGDYWRGRPKPPRSEATRRKLSEKEKGKKHSEARRRKNSEVHMGQIPWNKGIPHTEASRRKNREAHLGKPRHFTEEHKHNLKTSPKAIEQRRKLAEFNREREYTEEHRQNISKAQKGKPKPLSEKGLQRLVEYNKSRRGKPHPLSEEGRRRIAESNRIKKTGKPHSVSEETKRKMSEAHKRRAEQKRAKAYADGQTSFPGELLLYQQLHLNFEDRQKLSGDSSDQVDF